MFNTHSEIMPASRSSVSKIKIIRLAYLTGVSSVALGLLAPTAVAQNTVDDDEVVATGIIQSLKDAASIRRNEAGVVDAITAEDIADFPDANLAESLQRITGVSIDRQDNEGNHKAVHLTLQKLRRNLYQV